LPSKQQTAQCSQRDDEFVMGSIMSEVTISLFRTFALSTAELSQLASFYNDLDKIHKKILK